jgi:hypothetical protein
MTAITSHPFRIGVENRDMAAIEASLAPDVTFFAPILSAPFEGRERTMWALSFAAAAFSFTDSFRYVDELVSDRAVALVFRTQLDGDFLEGVDYLKLDDAGLIRELRISMRPISTVQKYVDFVLALASASQVGQSE